MLLPGFGSRSADIDSVGVVWASSGGGHLGSFDRRGYTGSLNGPAATGDHRPQGWEFYQFPGPGFGSLPDNNVESGYYIWVDNTLGLGKNVPIATGNLFDGFHALVYGRYVTLRVPYPMGCYARGLDGRIDDPSAGWKGQRALVHERRPGALAAGGRQGHEAACSAHPDATRSPGPLILRQPLLPS